MHNVAEHRAYEERVRDIEHGTFTPLIFAATGGLGRAATVMYRILASQLADKWKEPYGTVMGWLRCQISFSMTRSAIACLRGSRGSNCQIPHSLSWENHRLNCKRTILFPWLYFS